MVSDGSEQQTESYELQSGSQSPQLQPGSPSEPPQPTTGSTVSATAGSDPDTRSISGPLHILLNVLSSNIAPRSKTRLARAWSTLRNTCGAKGDMLLKAVATLTFLITIVALWSGVSSANDGHKAELIAEWTARKDFMEACETVSTQFIHAILC
ncbi:hypothetical protein PG997_005388 [Apiospora hydei]|uniref:Uncharacterized protein n=1 Tax=Apiospora hydei TaxID=1337664 RepID=A0ABR1X4W0_9PEZI